MPAQEAPAAAPDSDSRSARPQIPDIRALRALMKSAETNSEVVRTTATPAATPAARTVPPGHRECPRCKAVENWGMSSWCPRCGYYPALDDKRQDGTSWSDALLEDRAAAAQSRTVSAFGPWVYGMLGGTAAIFAVSIGAKFVLEDLEIPAGQWSWPQLGIGLVMMVVAHFFASRYAIRNDRRTSLFDAAICWVRIWQPTLFALPKGWLRVSVFVWGFTMVLCSILITGGLDINQFFEVDAKPLPRPNLPGKAISVAAKVAGDASAGSEGMEQSLRDFARTGDDVRKAANGAGTEDAANEEETGSEDGNAGGEAGDTGQSERDIPALREDAASFATDQDTVCTVFGYYRADDGNPSGVLLLHSNNGTLQHVASIDSSEMTAEAFHYLEMAVIGHEVPSPACRTYEQAVWVQPVVQCRVRYSGIAADGSFLNPRIVSVLRGTAPAASSHPETGSSAATKPAPRKRSAGRKASHGPIRKSSSGAMQFSNSAAPHNLPKSGTAGGPGPSGKSGGSGSRPRSQ